MANRARLVAPPASPQQVWPWHKAQCGTIAASSLLSGDRRLEAQTYLSSGFGIRAAIEHRSGWKRLGELANVWMPGRLKGIQVSREFGTPFLAATQVYDIRPIPRKWLALGKTSDAEHRFIKQGTILVTCSGSVGRPAVAYSVHDKTLISHDLLRVQATAHSATGWVYAFLHSPQSLAMAVGSHYGHIIKHLEPSHLQSLPVPPVDRKTAERFLEIFNRIIKLRNAGHSLTLAAEDHFSSALGGDLKIGDWGETGFSIKASKAFSRQRRRVDATFHNPGAAAIRARLQKRGEGFTTISDSGYKVWLPSRFKRVPAADGVWLFDSAGLTEINPPMRKRIADGDFGDAHKGRVKAGWVLMARSGQTYGIIGTPVIATPDLEDKIISDHVMRLMPGGKPSIAPGYLVTALGHPKLGRPLVKALAYGSSIPEIEVADMESFEIVRLPAADEKKTADMAQQAAESRASADVLEREMGAEAGEIIAAFMGGKIARGRDAEPQELSRRVLDVIVPD